MLTASTKNKAEKFISNRRLQEERVASLNSKLKEDFQWKELAKFENKGNGVAQANYVQKRLQELRERQKADVENRRERLLTLLASEDELYKQEIQNLEETPEQVRERMIKRVSELKAQKEDQRQREVAEKLERRFRDGADELRKVESEIGELKNMHLRNIQMMEKHQLMERDYQEEVIYAELWKRDILRKEQKERDEAEQRKKKVDEMNKVLHYQKESNDIRRQDEKNLSEREKEMLREQWRKEEWQQKEQQRLQLEINKQLNKEIFEHNVSQRSYKDAIVRAEKEADREMIQNIVRKEQLLDYLERENKERQKRETREFLLNFKNRTNELHTYEAELDRLIQEEMDRQYKKQQDIWKKEEDARIKLMYEVYDSRASDLQLKHTLKSQETIAKEIEKEQVTQDILRYEEELKRKKEEELRQNKIHQKVIVNQMEDKRDTEKRRLQERMAQEKADILANIEYMKKVQEEREKGKRALEELRKQRPY